MTWTVTGIPSTYRAPITAVEVVMGQGESNAAAGPRSVLYVVKKLAAASGTVNSREEITGEQAIIDIAGAGSEAHRVCRWHFKRNPSGRIYVCLYAPSSGGGGLVSATATFTVTSSGDASGAGQFTIVACGTEIEVGYSTGDTATEIGEFLEGRINSLTYLPFTAVNSSGTVTLTAKIAGASQNGVHRIRVKKDGTTGTNVSVAASAATLGSGAEGTTAELTNYTAALAAMVTTGDYYIANPVQVTTFPAATKVHVVAKNLPSTGLNCRGFYAFTGSLSSGISLAVTQNTELLQGFWLRNSDASPDEVLAEGVSMLQRGEAETSRYNFDGEALALPPAPSSGDWLTFNDMGDAVNGGITAFQSTETGTYCVMSCTTRSKDSTGALDDFRATESHRISIMHDVAAVLRTNHRLTYSNFAHKPDPLLPDGSVDIVAISRIEGRVTTPFLFKPWVLTQLNPFFSGPDGGRLQDQAGWEANTLSRIDPNNTGRMQTSASGRTIDLHHQATFRLQETTPN